MIRAADFDIDRREERFISGQQDPDRVRRDMRKESEEKEREPDKE